MKFSWSLFAAMLSITLVLSACLSRTEEEEETVMPGSLTAGSLHLLEYPVDATGVSGLGPNCRLVFECGCPLLFPDDIAYCRTEVWSYTEEFCEALLFNQLPECLD